MVGGGRECGERGIGTQWIQAPTGCIVSRADLVRRADLVLAMGQILYHSSPQLPFPFHLLLEYPKPLSVYYKLSQKGGIRNCSLLSILRDGETL